MSRRRRRRRRPAPTGVQLIQILGLALVLVMIILFRDQIAGGAGNFMATFGSEDITLPDERPDAGEGTDAAVRQ